VAYLEATRGIYEERRIEMLRDVFVVLYERSCERYQAVRRDMAEPDPVRLKYRTLLHSLVAEIVIEGLAPDATAIKTWAVAHDVHPTVLTAFVEIAMAVIDALHEGSISRYGIRPSQFATWREGVDAAARKSTLA